MSDYSELTEAAIGLLDAFAVQREAAKGYRLQLVSDGWSPEAAEDVAKLLLMEMIQSVFHPQEGGKS